MNIEKYIRRKIGVPHMRETHSVIYRSMERAFDEVLSASQIPRIVRRRRRRSRMWSHIGSFLESDLGMFSPYLLLIVIAFICVTFF